MNESHLPHNTPETSPGLDGITVYINAGGRGTRLEPILPKGEMGIVKAMLDFGGQPLLQHHLDLISRLGFSSIVVGAGDHEEIQEHFGAQEEEGLRIVTNPVELGTGGDLIRAIRETNAFGPLTLVENVDTLIYLKDIGEFLKQHKETGALATMVLTTRKGVPNEGAFLGDDNRRVLFTSEADPKYELRQPPNPVFRGSSTGIVLLDTEFLRTFPWTPDSGSFSIYRNIIPELIKRSGLFYYNNEDNFMVDVGTPSKFEQISAHSNQVLGGLGQRYKNQQDENPLL